MADKDKKKTLYEQMKELFIKKATYSKDLEALSQSGQAVQDAANIAAEQDEAEAAQSLYENDPYANHRNFLNAGLEEATKSFDKDFIKNRRNLEGILGDKNVQKFLPSAVFAYSPKTDKGAGKYAEAAKLHKEVKKMRETFGELTQGEGLSKDKQESLQAEVARYVIKHYAKKHSKKPLFLKAFVALAGGAVETDKEGKVKGVANDEEGNIAIVKNNEQSQNFALSRYNNFLKEKTKAFYELVGKDLPGYIAATLPEKETENFYGNLLSMEEREKQRKDKK